MTTVLYVHGLESGPRGRKALALEAAGFRVVSAQMPCGRRDVLGDPVVLGVLVLGLTALAALAAAWGVFGFLVGAISLSLLQRFVRPPLLRRVFRRSVEVQRRLLEAAPVDVVVGSSFGGAVALALLNDGAWRGPAVLLCPAHRLVAARAWTAALTLPPQASRVLVVHGRRDETVPLFDSRALVKDTQARLLEVDDDHRLSATATPEHLAAWVRQALDSPS